MLDTAGVEVGAVVLPGTPTLPASAPLAVLQASSNVRYVVSLGSIVRLPSVQPAVVFVHVAPLASLTWGFKLGVTSTTPLNFFNLLTSTLLLTPLTVPVADVACPPAA